MILSRLQFALITIFLLPLFQYRILGDDAKTSTPNPDIAAANQFYRAGKFVEAEDGYQALLKADSNFLPAEAGLVRAMLRQQKLDEALTAADKALAAQPNSAALLAVKGDVEFRRSEMTEAEQSYLTAKRLDPKEAHAYLGLARLYASFSLRRKAYDLLQTAHEIAP